MKEFKSTKGKRVVINPAPFKVVKRLRKTFANELLKVNIDIGNAQSLEELKNVYSENKLLNILKNVLLGLEVSEEFEDVIFECLQECTYDNITITSDLFDDKPELRQDYDRIVLEVVKENLNPFIKGVVGMFSTTTQTTENSQE